MRATGIVRRIDDLGRVVIPKEIRRTLHLKEGDPLELYTDTDGAIVFKKYSPSNINEVADYLADTASALGFTIGVYDDLGTVRGGSRIGSYNDHIDLEAEKENLIIVADEDIFDRGYLFIKVIHSSKIATLESIKALAKMASIILNC